MKDLSLADRMEVTKKYAKAHQTASKKDKTRILDQVVAVTGRNRGHVCQQLRRRDGPSRRSWSSIDADPCKYSCDARLVLGRREPARMSATSSGTFTPTGSPSRHGRRPARTQARRCPKRREPSQADGSAVSRLGGANPGRRPSRAKRVGADVGSAACCRF